MMVDTSGNLEAIQARVILNPQCNCCFGCPWHAFKGPILWNILSRVLQAAEDQLTKGLAWHSGMCTLRGPRQLTSS